MIEYTRTSSPDDWTLRERGISDHLSGRAELSIKNRSKDEITGTVFNIQGYSIHDGPGIRTVVFLKGCPMRCLWCSNPESQSFYPEVEFFEGRCIPCGRCLKACNRGAINPDLAVASGYKIDKSLCDECGACVRSCPTEALRLTGTERTVSEVLDRIKKDGPYYRKSGGGVTLSGGEPLVQPGFSMGILRACYSSNIHTAIETAGCVPWKHFEDILAFTDLILYDIKHMNDALHRQMTGVSNQLILENVRRIAQTKMEMIVRIPLIPGYNATEDNLRATAAYLSRLSLREVHLLPFHQLGRDKYKRLCREYGMGGKETSIGSHDDERDCLPKAKEILEGYGLSVQIGG